MTWKYLPVVVLAGAILAVSSSDASALGLRKHSCGAVAGGCGEYAAAYAPCETPYAPPAPVATKRIVTEYVPEEYNTTVTVYETKTKEEKYTAYRCETVAVPKKVMVTYYKSVPREVERPVVRYEQVQVPEKVVVTRCVPVQVPVERTVMRCVSQPEEVVRDVTRYVTSSVPVTTYVSRCVDKGGHYECREVPCGGGGNGRHGLFRHRHDDCCECPPPVMTVSVYVPNYVTEQVPVQTYRTVCTPVTEKVKMTIYKTVQVPEKITVMVCQLQEVKETVTVMRCQLVEKKETIRQTIFECVAVPKEETVTYYESKMVPFEASRMVCVSVPVEKTVKAVRYKPVEKEIMVYESPCTDYGAGYGCGGYTSSCCSGRRHGLFRH